MRLMDKRVEALVHRLSDHFSSRDQLGVELVEYVLEEVAFDSLFSIEQIEEFLNELRGNVDFKGSDLDSLTHDQLEEKLIDSTEMGPGRVDVFFLFDTSLSEVEIAAFDVGKRSEDVLLDHSHDLIQLRHNE